MDFKKTRLWHTALEPVPEDPDGGRARASLREALLGFRDRAQLLAAEIPRDLPGFTVHDITHLDALWEMADLIAGPDISLTPLEAFVLGGAILLHDLGMSLAAYPGGLEELKRSSEWQDAVARLLRQELGRWPTVHEIQHPPPEIVAEAIREALRLLHAEQAARLSLASWTEERSGTRYQLIDHTDIRKSLGELVGRVAQSHHWPVSRLAREFPETLGAPGWCPRSWELDPLKVACLLRLADASHLDARRAPGFLRALRQPRGVSDSHWAFQERLLKPRLEAQRLIFSSSSKFPEEEAPAWWLCLDALTLVDRELRQVDALLVELKRTRLAAQGVAGIENPERMVSLIRTDGWIPVDTRVRIGDVPALVERLGGRQLYGNNPEVPLRELIQNAADAVRARRLQEGKASDWGDITVRLGKDEEGYWLEVEDTGLGMSQEVLKGPLLDFGTSYWSSDLAREECPGLWSKGFQPTGRYGIGFFSVLMWGDHIRVSTRRAEEAQRDTRVLEFNRGIASPPLLRLARTDERLVEGGTRVRVWLRESPFEPGNLLNPDTPMEEQQFTLWELLVRRCPCLDANLYAEELPEPRKLVVRASDWLNMEGSALLERLWDSRGTVTSDMLNLMGRNLRLLKSPTGEIVGRACIDVQRFTNSSDDALLGKLCSGGFIADHAKAMAGVLTGSPRTMDRHSVCPDVDPETLASWASEQGRLWHQESLSEEDQHWVAAAVCQYGGDTGPLPVALGADGWLTSEDIATRQWPSQLVLIDPVDIEVPDDYPSEFGFGVLAMHQEKALTIQRSVLLVRTRVAIASDRWWGDWLNGRGSRKTGPARPPPSRSLVSVVVNALARAWAVKREGILVQSVRLEEDKSTKGAIEDSAGNGLAFARGSASCLLVTKESAG